MLSANRLVPETFETMQRDTLLFDELHRIITGSVKVSEAEVADWYTWSKAAVKIDYVLIPSEKYTKITASPEEVAQYFERHKESYRTEPELQVRYLHFAPQDYLDKVTLTDAEIRDAYDSNPERFTIPKTVEARHILIKVAPDASPEAVEKAREKILEVLKLAREGKDFGELAKQYSEDSDARTGRRAGDLPQGGHDPALCRCGFRPETRRDQRAGAHALRLAPDQGRKSQRGAHPELR